MGAPLKLTPLDLNNLATALEGLTQITKDTGVNFCAYGSLDIEVNGNYINIQHNGDIYLVDDRTGD
jgi:hypothetical protein